MKKVSIIVPIYNAEKYLKRCLNTIINQTYKNIEIILINDGSKDNSLNILKEYQNNDSRIIIIDKNNTGVSDSRNYGINKASGEYVAFVDSDDWLELDMIEQMIKVINEKKVDIVRCNYFRNYEDGTQKIGEKYNYNIKGKILDQKEIKEKVLTRILSGEIPGYMWTLLIKKNILNKLKPLNMKLAMMEDTIFYIDLLLNIENMYIYDKALYHYFYNQNSASQSIKNYIRNYKNLLLVNKIENKMLEEKEINNKKIKEIYNTTHAHFIENTCFKIFKTENKNEIKKIYLNIINDENVKDILSKAKISKIPIQNRIALRLIINKKEEKLIDYYKVRIKFSKLKTFITKRKEI